MLANNVSPTANVSPCSREESSKRMQEGAKLIDENTTFINGTVNVKKGPLFRRHCTNPDGTNKSTYVCQHAKNT